MMNFSFVITPLSQSVLPQLQQKVNSKTKPLGALGRLESLALQIGQIQNTSMPNIKQASILIFAADHGIANEQVSAYPQTVTAQMVENFLAGGAAINVFARQHRLNLHIIDAGVCGDLAPHPALINAKIAYGTRNVLYETAMTEQQCYQALQYGAKLVKQQYNNGCNCIGLGEMGIANSSSAALLMHCLLQLPLDRCVGRGTGVSDQQLMHKQDVLQQTIKRHGSDHDWISALMHFGGFEIAMMVGAYWQAAELNMLILVDGFITSVALLLACQQYPHVVDYCVFSHVSAENGHQLVLDALNAQPLLNLSLRLGEGSAVALAYPLVESAVCFLNEMASFDDAGVDTAL